MDSWSAYHEFEPSAAEDPQCRGGRRTLNISRLKPPPVGVVWYLGEVGEHYYSAIAAFLTRKMNVKLVLAQSRSLNAEVIIEGSQAFFKRRDPCEKNKGNEEKRREGKKERVC
ncbi:hypothetical protein TNCV_2723411 [Trichonephila clavipes]|nr:hypothetical protein TNCV_2723411 [Trichonephila clavipes]